ncbi:MAG TPA: Gfo/Idh/MocA family oxidoreductase [Lacunisphaera sp.]|nr:Gfo/Idh/MocA family oxidoreductase [Lacunisphaera sp.]
MTLIRFLLLLLATPLLLSAAPLRVGVAGLTHDHVHWLLDHAGRGEVEIVGIVEPNRELARRHLERYKLPLTLLYPSLEGMIAVTKPEAVLAFGSTFAHLAVVEACAPRGVHVMVEKPLAVNGKHARRIEALAREHRIQVLTNYETTWYATNHRAHALLRSGDLGELRKVVIHDGHPGPKEIGVSPEFLQWLTDPVQNGGGALTDFGCYGANLLTWLTNGRRPLAVTAVLRRHKPDVYPRVDDEATILVEYPGAQGIIQASWNWPFGRKDMEVYGATGYVVSENRSTLRLRLRGDEAVRTESLPERPAPHHDSLAYLAAVVRHQTTPEAYDLSSLENNLLVVDILDAARESARTGRRTTLP